MFIIVFTAAYNWARCKCFIALLLISYYITSLIIRRLHLSLPCFLFPSVLPITIVHRFSAFPCMFNPARILLLKLGLQTSRFFTVASRHHHHHRISVMELGPLLTRSVLVYPEVSSKVCHDSFCQSESSVSVTLGKLLRGILFTCCIQFLLYSSNLSKIGVIFNSFAICVFVL